MATTPDSRREMGTKGVNSKSIAAHCWLKIPGVQVNSPAGH